MSQRLALFRTDAMCRRDQQFRGASVLTTRLSVKVLAAAAAAADPRLACVLLWE